MSTDRLPTVIDRCDTEDGFIAQLQLSSDLLYFQGHFAGFTILPGVCQIKWVLDLCQDKIPGKYSHDISKLKFTHPIKPDDDVSLEVQFKADKINFRYFNNKVTFSKGTISYA
jgi:3-hydroxymyristoyl/3-hydroxydecanoyl-(acyl carrier protein) dehydratase